MSDIIDGYGLNTGGGCMVDLLVLDNGYVIGISDELVCLYESMEHWDEGLDAMYCVDINIPFKLCDYKQTWPFIYVKHAEEFAGMDVITLINGDQVFISAGTITVAPSTFKLPQGEWISMTAS